MSFGKRCSKCRRDFQPSGFYSETHSWCRSCMAVYKKGYMRRVWLSRVVRDALRAVK